MSDPAAIAKAFGPHTKALALYHSIFDKQASPVSPCPASSGPERLATVLSTPPCLCSCLPGLQKPWLDRTHALVNRAHRRSSR